MPRPNLSLIPSPQPPQSSAISRGRVSSTDSPLAKPSTPVHRLASALQSLLFLPDPSPLYAVAGTLLANAMRGYPVWLMLIGPPSSGKTQLIKPLLGIDGVRECGDLSGKQALLSGTKQKEVVADARGGLLKELYTDSRGDARGVLVMLDFARTILAANPDQIREKLGILGMLHDRHYERNIGEGGGRTLSWHGRVGFIAASTDAIDSHQYANAEMGERCIYYRYPDSSGFHETKTALQRPDPDEVSSDIGDLFAEFARESKLDWEDPRPPRDLDNVEISRIGALATFSARGRSGVDREKYGKREVTGVRRAEMAPRLATGLAQLLRGLERAGCTSTESWRVLCQIALDSLPALRSDALRAITRAGGHAGTAAISNALRMSVTATARVMEDLYIHNMVEQIGGASWRMTAWAAEQWTLGFGKPIEESY